MSIDVNYGHIADVSIKSFADLSSPSVAQKATIQVNKNTFSVSIREDGRVDVSFKGFKFMYLFRGYTKTRLRNQIEAQINDWRTAIAKPSRQSRTRSAPIPRRRSARRSATTWTARWMPTGPKWPCTGFPTFAG